ncbi:hypothetical protein L226DRAFT_537939 [Lentinus tigrinus ALCF2SS1-7]|uniref:Uncharacterized protein n=1 Tax=Lentinus tigrinus ALCF2SS1-6 TaxID=1328759 RepID=A0A5C2RZZ4_9APHY|nr:hypothetical protein L227DRAFT_578571 [Lentinus tigrinus ALCF2SS1-6]RPD71671.1 hypothetical protein L226DRAFT_537939 [Lentinus tigrinus ALCF2SS1-7]
MPLEDPRRPRTPLSRATSMQTPSVLSCAASVTARPVLHTLDTQGFQFVRFPSVEKDFVDADMIKTGIR